MPLEVGARGLGLAGGVVALGGGLVILGAELPGVIRDLVVVPGHDPRVLLVGADQGAVESVEGVAPAVLFEGGDFGIGEGDAVREARIAVDAVGVLVDVVPDVEHGIEVGAVGDAVVSVKKTRIVVGARHEYEAQVLGGVYPGRSCRRGSGRGARPADQRVASVVAEHVVIGGGWRKAAQVNLDGVIACGVGGDGALRDNLAEGGIARNVVVYFGAGLLGGNPGPEYDAVGEWVAGGDAVVEGRQCRVEETSRLRVEVLAKAP